MVNITYRHNNHSVTKPTVHIVWITKYRYKVPIGYGAWSTGNIIDKVVEDYLKHHFKNKSNQINKLKLTQ